MLGIKEVEDGNLMVYILYQGRKLDYDCKKRQQQSKGQVPDKEIKQVAILIITTLVMVMEIIFSCWPKSV